MADSSYWNKQYKAQKNLVNDLKDNIEDLEKIQGKLRDDLWDEIRNVNNEYDELKEDMAKAVRHNASFTNCTNSIINNKEIAALSDANLSVTDSRIGDELSRLKTKKSQAETARDNAKSNYDTAKDAEREAAWQGVVDFFT